MNNLKKGNKFKTIFIDVYADRTDEITPCVQYLITHYTVLDTNVKDDAHGTVRLLKRTQVRFSIFCARMASIRVAHGLQQVIPCEFVNDEIVVERQWFDEELTGRRMVWESEVDSVRA